MKRNSLKAEIFAAQKNKDHQKAIELFNSMDNKSDYEWLRLAECYVHLHQPNPSLNILKKLQLKMGNSNLGLYYYILSYTHILLKQYDLAIKIFKKTPDNLQNDFHHANIIWLLHKKAEYKKSRLLVKEFLEKFPKSSLKPGILLSCVRRLKEDGEHKDSLALMEKLQVSFPSLLEDEQHKITYANLLSFNGKSDEAEKIIRSLWEKMKLTKEPNENILMCYGYIRLTHNPDDSKTARHIFKQVIDNFPTNYSARIAYISFGKFEGSLPVEINEASKILRPILDDKSRSKAIKNFKAKAYVQLAILYRQKPDLETAEQYANKALTLDRAYAPAYSVLGHISKDRNQFQKSSQYHERALSLDPERFASKHRLRKDEKNHQSEIKVDHFTTDIIKAIDHPVTSSAVQQSRRSSLPVSMPVSKPKRRRACSMPSIDTKQNQEVIPKTKPPIIQGCSAKTARRFSQDIVAAPYKEVQVTNYFRCLNLPEPQSCEEEIQSPTSPPAPIKLPHRNIDSKKIEVVITQLSIPSRQYSCVRPEIFILTFVGILAYTAGVHSGSDSLNSLLLSIGFMTISIACYKIVHRPNEYLPSSSHANNSASLISSNRKQRSHYHAAQIKANSAREYQPKGC